jgi:hypothetical protein
MHQFGHRGDRVDERAASFTFWRDGARLFSARAVCEHCRCFIVSTASGGTFKTKDDEEMCKFFMLKPLANPASMMRWSADFASPGLVYPVAGSAADVGSDV